MLPKLENIANFIVILPVMKNNYKNYPDLIFIDTSMKHKIPLSLNQKYQGFGAKTISLPGQDLEQEITLMLLSGVNCEGKSILFAWGFLKDPNIENYSWFLNKFIMFMAEDEIAKNLVNLTDYQEEDNIEDNVEFQ